MHDKSTYVYMFYMKVIILHLSLSSHGIHSVAQDSGAVFEKIKCITSNYFLHYSVIGKTLTSRQPKLSFDGTCNDSSLLTEENLARSGSTERAYDFFII